MIDHSTALLALRNRARVLVVRASGAIAMSATADGYVRADAGSFVTDDFRVGMEVVGAGFSQANNNASGVITAVTASTLSIHGGRTVEASGSGKSLTVGLPVLRALENEDFTPVAHRHYVAEEYLPAPSSLLSAPAVGGLVEESGLYVLRWYGVKDTGFTGLRKCIDALLALFTPGTAFTIGSNTLHVRTDLGPFAGRFVPDAEGRPVCTVTIPWRAYSANAIAA